MTCHPSILRVKDEKSPHDERLDGIIIPSLTGIARRIGGTEERAIMETWKLAHDLLAHAKDSPGEHASDLKRIGAQIAEALDQDEITTVLRDLADRLRGERIWEVEVEVSFVRTIKVEALSRVAALHLATSAPDEVLDMLEGSVEGLEVEVQGAVEA